MNQLQAVALNEGPASVRSSIWHLVVHSVDGGWRFPIYLRFSAPGDHQATERSENGHQILEFVVFIVSVIAASPAGPIENCFRTSQQPWVTPAADAAALQWGAEALLMGLC